MPRRASTGTCSRWASAASVPGAVIGARLTGRLSTDQLLRAIGALLVVAGVGILVQAAA